MSGRGGSFFLFLLSLSLIEGRSRETNPVLEWLDVNYGDFSCLSNCTISSAGWGATSRLCTKFLFFFFFFLRIILTQQIHFLFLLIFLFPYSFPIFLSFSLFPSLSDKVYLRTISVLPDKASQIAFHWELGSVS